MASFLKKEIFKLLKSLKFKNLKTSSFRIPCLLWAAAAAYTILKRRARK
jgi:hypothetical protein